jgi:hypothetical protein
MAFSGRMAKKKKRTKVNNKIKKNVLKLTLIKDKKSGFTYVFRNEQTKTSCQQDQIGIIPPSYLKLNSGVIGVHHKKKPVFTGFFQNFARNFYSCLKVFMIASLMPI